MIPGVPPALISIHGDLVELAMLRVAVISQGSGPSRDLLSLLYLRRELEGAWDPVGSDVPGGRLLSGC